MLYLLDANVLITADRDYYNLEQWPQFWEWLVAEGAAGRIKMPEEMIEEVTAGRDDDPLCVWLKVPAHKNALLLPEAADLARVQRVLAEGYARDLRDDELEVIGKDPFLIAAALANPRERCVVTTETSAPSKQRANRKLPDVCATFGVSAINTFRMTKALGFRSGG